MSFADKRAKRTGKNMNRKPTVDEQILKHGSRTKTDGPFNRTETGRFFLTCIVVAYRGDYQWICHSPA